MLLAEGIKLGRYEIRAHIGTGGMGQVYLAQDTSEFNRITDKDTILLSEFENKTGEAVFDDTLRQGLARASGNNETVRSGGSAFATNVTRDGLFEARRPAQAAAEARRILDHRGQAPLSTLWPLAHLALARASAMQSDTAQAWQSYQDFFTLWKDADQDTRS